MRARAIAMIARALILYHISGSRIRQAGSSGPSESAATGCSDAHWLECWSSEEEKVAEPDCWDGFWAEPLPSAASEDPVFVVAAA